MATWRTVQGRNAHRGLSEGEAELKYAFLPPSPPNYWFQSLPTAKVKRLLSTPLKASGRELPF